MRRYCLQEGVLAETFDCFGFFDPVLLSRSLTFSLMISVSFVREMILLISNTQRSCLLLKLGPAVVIPFGFLMSPERHGQVYTTYFKNVTLGLKKK